LLLLEDKAGEVADLRAYCLLNFLSLMTNDYQNRFGIQRLGSADNVCD